MNPPGLHKWISEVNRKLSVMEMIAQYKLQRSRVPSSRRRKPELSWTRNKSIHRLPTYIREKLHPQYYKPCQVGFGPYHDINEYPRWFQIKQRVLLYFLKRSNKPLDEYVKAVKCNFHLVLKDTYGELGPDNRFQDDNQALFRLIHDGCFLLELLRELRNLSEANYWGKDYKSDNPLWDVQGIDRSKLVEDYIHDMLLLENQLPLQLLVSLHAVSSFQLKEDVSSVQLDKVHAALEDISMCMLWIFLPTQAQKWFPRKLVSFTSVHILDIYRYILVEQETFLDHSVLYECSKARTAIEIDLEFNFNIPSATELNDAGIGITMSKTKGLMSISFESGTLKLPQIYVDGATRSRFINMIAFEQLDEEAAYSFSSYVYFMSGLLKGANDVSILQSCGVICSRLRNDDVAEMFNSLTKDIMRHPQTFLNETFIDLSDSLVKSFDKKNKESKKDLWQKYLGSPWAIASLVAAFLLFALSVIQTVYTVLGYYKS